VQRTVLLVAENGVVEIIDDRIDRIGDARVIDHKATVIISTALADHFHTVAVAVDIAALVAAGEVAKAVSGFEAKGFANVMHQIQEAL
jgi:hypothetical protein